MPKVLVYSPLVGRGGMSRLVQKLIAEWTKNKRWEFYVVSHDKDEFGNPLVWKGALETTLLDPLPLHPQLFKALTANLPSYYEVLKAVVARIQPDLIFLPSGWWTTRGVQWDIKIPTVAFIPDFAMDYIAEFREDPDYMAWRAEAFELSKFVKMLITPSAHQADYARRYGFKDVRVIYHNAFIPEPFDLSAENAERVLKKYNLPREGYTLAFHAANHKDPITVLNAQHMARQIAKVPALVIAGIETAEYNPYTPATNDYSRSVQTLVRKNRAQINKDLYVLGEIPVEDIGGVYSGATAAVTASRSEGGLSGAICEAAMSKTPLVYSDFPVMQERLTDEIHGLSFPVGNPLEMALAVVRTYHDPVAAAERAEQLFMMMQSPTWSEVAKTYLDLFREAIG